MQIAVTTKHIKRGEPRDTASCPIALALTSAGVEDVSVDTDDISGSRDGLAFHYATPSKLARFIDRYDDDKNVKPFKFKMKLPALI